MLCEVEEGVGIGLNLGRTSNEDGRNEKFITFFSSRLKEGEVLIANSSTDVFLLFSHQHFGKNTDEGQNKKKAVARQKGWDVLKRHCLCHPAVVRKVKMHFRIQE